MVSSVTNLLMGYVNTTAVAMTVIRKLQRLQQQTTTGFSNVNLTLHLSSFWN